MTRTHHRYVGRFAPSPSGPLHFGSLIAALGSFLRARQNDGLWRVRIEDIDPPREVTGAAEQILDTLVAHGLDWDGEVTFQSQHSSYYDDALFRLSQSGLTYYCRCTRAQIKAAGGRYRGQCRGKNWPAEESSQRLLNQRPVHQFQDAHLGLVEADPEVSGEDFILRRKDGLYAYHLAVVVDDLRQGVTEIVRGADLLETTCCQLALYHALGGTAPGYLHLPVAVSAPGRKLSKQNHSPALDNRQALDNLRHALVFLGLPAQKVWSWSHQGALLDWAVGHWSETILPRRREILHNG